MSTWSISDKNDLRIEYSSILQRTLFSWGHQLFIEHLHFIKNRSGHLEKISNNGNGKHKWCISEEAAAENFKAATRKTSSLCSCSCSGGIPSSISHPSILDDCHVRLHHHRLVVVGPHSHPHRVYVPCVVSHPPVIHLQLYLFSSPQIIIVFYSLSWAF